MNYYSATALDSIPSILKELNASFSNGKTLPIQWRKEQLTKLWNLIDENEDAFRKAVFNDVGKPLVQTQVLEILCVKNDIIHCIANLDDWLQDEKVAVPTPFEYWSPLIRRRPKGTCLVIGTWNYPLCLTLLPFIGVIACGNTGIIKPSEVAPHTAALLADLFPKYLDNHCFRIVNGDKETSISLLENPLGHVLFTGGTIIGKEVMKLAAKNLTPVTLELGGRNAAVVTELANIKLAAKRILWAKFAIAGQTCFAPNHVLVHDSLYEEFVAAMCELHQEFYKGKPEISTVGRIVNDAHWKRVMSLISSTSGNIVFGGKGNEETLFVEPTVIKDVAEDDVVLESENFAPILPILRYTTFEDAKGKLDQLSPTALALYVFTEDMEEAHRFIDSSLTGTVAINDAMAQIAPSSLPFGGVGQSGMGAYRGLASIDTFSHKQSMVNVPTTTQFEALLEWRYAGKESMETVAFVKTNMEARLT